MTKGNSSQCFYSLPEFEEWKEEHDNFHTWKIKYYKGETNLQNGLDYIYRFRSGNLNIERSKGVL